MKKILYFGMLSVLHLCAPPKKELIIVTNQVDDVASLHSEHAGTPKNAMPQTPGTAFGGVYGKGTAKHLSQLTIFDHQEKTLNSSSNANSNYSLATSQVSSHASSGDSLNKKRKNRFAEALYAIFRIKNK